MTPQSSQTLILAGAIFLLVIKAKLIEKMISVTRVAFNQPEGSIPIGNRQVQTQ